MSKRILGASTREYKEGYKKGVKDTVRDYSAVVMLVLKDKFDFTTLQLQEASEYINDTFDSVCEGYLSLADISNTLEEENSLELRFQGQIPDEHAGMFKENYFTISSNFTGDKEDLERRLYEAGIFEAARHKNRLYNERSD